MLSTSGTVTQVAEAFAMHEMSFVADGHNAPDRALTLGPGTDLIPSLDSLLQGTTSTLTTVVSGSLQVGTPQQGASQGALQAALGAVQQGSPTQGTPQGSNPQGNPQGNPQQVVPQISDPARLSTLAGLPLLQQLAMLPRESIAQFVAQHPDVVQKLVTTPPGAHEVELWWGDMAIDSRSALLSSAPYLVGNLEGVPFSMRDRANRHLLDASMSMLGEAAAGGRSKAIDASNQLHMLQQIADALVAPKGAPARYLLNLNPTGTGTAAIVIGDLSTADYVSFLVPGMFYTVDGQMVDWATAAQSFYDTESAWMTQLSGTETNLDDASLATVAWIGYETPSLVNFTSLELAYAGRDAIADAITGLRTMRGADQPYLSLIAHSYGSTAAMMALTDYGIDIDAIGIVGSPGSSAQFASDLGVPGNNVYVGEADWDQVKDTAFFGSDPGSDSFGAHVFSVDGGTDPVTGSSMAGSVGHNEYFVAGSESIRNLALVALGQGRLVTSDGAAAVAKGSSGYAVSHSG
jgi:hypothetical protein